MSETLPRAGLFKRLAAIVYDFLIVVALLMLATAVTLIAVNLLVNAQWLDISEYTEPSVYLNNQWWFKLILALCVWGFFAWFWYDGGQTLGMRAWRLKVLDQNGHAAQFKQCALRALFALGGLGNLMILMNPKRKLALQDKLTQTQVVVLTKAQNKQVYLRGIEDPNR